MKKSFDVLYYIPRFYPAISGAEFYILNLAKNMHLSSKTVKILCSTSIDFKGIRSKDGLHIEPSHPNYQSYKNIPIQRIIPDYELNNRKINDLLYGINIPDDFDIQEIIINGPNHTSFFLELIKNKNNPPFTGKLIHSSYSPYATLLFSLIYSHHMQIPSVCTPFIHMYNPRYQNEHYIQLLKLYDRVITCTNTEKTYLINKGISDKKIATIPMGVDYRLYSSPQKTRSGNLKSFKEAFGIKRPFALYCGYKNHEKGAISVLRAAVDVLNKLPKLMYVFIGPSTPAFDIELKKARQNGVSVLNLTPNNLKGYYDWRKIAAFQECEMYVMPSRSDAYGISFLEAWASKKPVIGADTPVMREVIQHNIDGILVEFNNISQISESIELLYTNKQKSVEMGLIGYSKTCKNNTWQQIHQKTQDVYDELVNLNK